MSRSLLTPFVLVATCIFFFPPTAAGQGNSAIDQYTENLPTVNGETSPPKGFGDAAAAPPPEGGLSSGVIEQLEAAGADGRRAADLANAGSASNPSPSERVDNEFPFEAPETGGISALIPQAFGFSSSGGMGPVFPAILGLTLIGGAVLLLMRRRDNQGGNGADSN